MTFTIQSTIHFIDIPSDLQVTFLQEVHWTREDSATGQFTWNIWCLKINNLLLSDKTMYLFGKSLSSVFPVNYKNLRVTSWGVIVFNRRSNLVKKKTVKKYPQTTLIIISTTTNSKNRSQIGRGNIEENSRVVNKQVIKELGDKRIHSQFRTTCEQLRASHTVP